MVLNILKFKVMSVVLILVSEKAKEYMYLSENTHKSLPLATAWQGNYLGL